ncbi:MAG TPA: ABC transporter substrate-binding protein [Spirochaetales bacterium]|jgi:peptide/nickel transport system substrate-binding protein|nr:ABC transporter substrate-binding protein [Spirochaetales bacterium]
MRKRIFVTFLIVAVVLSAAFAKGATEAAPNVETQVILGSSTQVNGDFFDGWTNSATNAYLKGLMGGYETVAWTKEGRYEVNPVAITSFDAVDNADGTKTYTFHLANNLTYNDGHHITASDYVFNILYAASPQAVEIGASYGTGPEYVGYEDYHSGKVNYFEGIKIHSDYSFSITIKAEELPYFFDLSLVSVGPLPLHVIAPGVEVLNTAKGAALSSNFTADLLRQTVLTPGTGYRYKPLVTSGPYQFENYNPADSTASVVLNPLFLGEYDGAKGSIYRIIIKLTNTATEMDELRTGAIDMLQGVSGGDSISRGLDLYDQGIVNFASYPRYGYGKIAFACDFGPTQFDAVRRAIAYSLDRNEFARQYTGGYGIIVNGYYGASMWEYVQNATLLDKELNAYPFNLQKAEDELVKDGWTLNKDGKPFQKGVDTIRYKRVDGALMPLIIEWANTANNPVSDLIATMLVPEVRKIGMQINGTTVDFAVLLDHLYKDNIDKPVYGMFNLGTGFATTQAYWYYYSTDPEFFGVYNTNFISDKELEAISLDMKKTDPADLDGWVEKWIKFQKRWNYLLPDIPLYSDVYHDFFNPRIVGYDSLSTWDFRYAIIRASVK